MNGELNFEAMAFEADDGSRVPAADRTCSELEEEFGRRSRSRWQGSAARKKQARLGPQSVRPVRPKKSPIQLPPFLPHRFGWPSIVTAGSGPFDAVMEPTGGSLGPNGGAPDPHAAEPLATGSEHIRWVQSALNEALGSRLPVHGMMDAATRSAIRSFQQREGLPVDGIVGPDTERTLIEARSGKSHRGGAPGPAEPDPPESSGSQTSPAEHGAAAAIDPASSPAAQSEFEWESVTDPKQGADPATVRSRIAAGRSSPNMFVNHVHSQRHSGPGADIKISDREVGATLAMAAKKVPRLGMSLEQLLVRHQLESGGVPIELLLAFIRREAGTHLFEDATAGYWAKDKKGKPIRYVPSPRFYELGVFQTPAGLHGCVPAGDNGVQRSCRHKPPGDNVKDSEFGKGWHRLTGTYPTMENWTDPTMQVRIGLWNLNGPAETIRKEFGELFPSQRSEWYWRMAVLYSFSAGTGWSRAFLSQYRKDLVALPEAQRWDFLRGKKAQRKIRVNKNMRVEVKTFNPENVDQKMALAAKLRTVRRASTAQSPGGKR
jgi:Putative peptidoglycan binding domain